MNPKISAIICAYNRMERLRVAIQSLADQTLPIRDYEIIVVDNASTDRTKEVILKEFAHLPNIVYHYEANQGVSHARNAGWRNARADYVAFIDDDEAASPFWLENMLKAFQRHAGKTACVGGRVMPFWPSPRPKWLVKEIEYFIGILDLGNEEKMINGTGSYLGSGNFAFRKECLEEISGFPAVLGRTDKGLLQGEDTFAQILMEKKGYGILYDPAIEVWHHIERNRLTKKYMLEWAYSSGFSLSIIERLQKPMSIREKSASGLRILTKLLLSPKNLSAIIVPLAPNTLFARKCRSFLEFGRLMGIFVREYRHSI